MKKNIKVFKIEVIPFTPLNIYPVYPPLNLCFLPISIFFQNLQHKNKPPSTNWNQQKYVTSYFKKNYNILLLHDTYSWSQESTPDSPIGPLAVCLFQKMASSVTSMTHTAVVQKLQDK